MQEFFDSNQGYCKYFQIGLKIRFLKCREREGEREGVVEISE